MADKEEKKEEEKIEFPSGDEDQGEYGKPPEGYTQEEWDDLSDDEKEGILDDLRLKAQGLEEEPEEEIDEDLLKEIAGEKEVAPEKKAEEKAPEKKPEAEEKPAEEKPPEEKPEEEKPPEEVPEEERLDDEDLLGFKPFIAESEIKVEERITLEQQTKLDDLEAKLDSGDMDRKEYDKGRDAVNREINRDMMAERDRVRADVTWEKEQRFFFDNRPEYLGELAKDGKFHPTAKSRALYGALSEEIATISKDPKFISAPGMALLIAADKEVKEALGIVEKPKEKKEAAPPEKGAKEEAVKKEGAEKPPAEIPEVKTLADVPAAGSNTTEGAWAQLDKLRGEAYEEALERLTPKQRAAYEDDADRRMGRM